MAEALDHWAPRVASALQRTPETMRLVLLERFRRWREAARRLAPRDRGDLVRAIDGAAEDTRASLAIPSEYVAVEEGATIRPTRGQWLAVPIVPAARLLPGPRSDVADLFVVTTRDGRRFLASRSGGGIELRWKLERETQIRGQGFMARAMAEAADGFDEALLDALEAEVLDG